MVGAAVHLHILALQSLDATAHISTLDLAVRPLDLTAQAWQNDSFHAQPVGLITIDSCTVEFHLIGYTLFNFL